jgi:hypothetical protein
VLEQVYERDRLSVVQLKLEPVEGTVVVKQVPESALC